MVIYKVLIAILLIVIGTLIGFFMSGNLKNRLDELLEYQLLLKRVQIFLSYENMSTYEIIKKLAQTHDLRRLSFVLDVDNQLETVKNFPVVWHECVKKSSLFVDENDKEMMDSLGEILGAFDIKSQQESIALQEKLLDEKIIFAREKCLQLGKLYKNLGVLAGIAGAVMLI